MSLHGPERVNSKLSHFGVVLCVSGFKSKGGNIGKGGGNVLPPRAPLLSSFSLVKLRYWKGHLHRYSKTAWAGAYRELSLMGAELAHSLHGCPSFYILAALLCYTKHLSCLLSLFGSPNLQQIPFFIGGQCKTKWQGSAHSLFISTFSIPAPPLLGQRHGS